jgi:sulfatase maturation enzyme AslB (radical SAM superfamily)
MKELIKIITTQEPNLLDIRFWPTDICNYNCAYCFPGSVTNKLRYQKILILLLKTLEYYSTVIYKNIIKQNLKLILSAVANLLYGLILHNFVKKLKNNTMCIYSLQLMEAELCVGLQKIHKMLTKLY